MSHRIPQPIPLHAVSSTASTPVPHWVVLLVAVPVLLMVIAGGVVVIDRTFEWAAGTE